jgi:hypothetical protein
MGHIAARNDKHMTNATRTTVGKLENLLGFASTRMYSTMTWELTATIIDSDINQL